MATHAAITADEPIVAYVRRLRAKEPAVGGSEIVQRRGSGAHHPSVEAPVAGTFDTAGPRRSDDVVTPRSLEGPGG
jgi:hypothetical protein